MSGDLDDLLRERACGGGSEPAEGGVVLLVLVFAVLIVLGIVATLL